MKEVKKQVKVLAIKEVTPYALRDHINSLKIDPENLVKIDFYQVTEEAYGNGRNYIKYGAYVVFISDRDEDDTNDKQEK